MRARADGAKNMAAIELAGGKEIQRGSEESNPRGAADRIDKQILYRNTGINQGRHQVQKKRIAEGERSLRFRKDEKFGVHDAVEERGDGKDKSNERAAGAHVEERTIGADARAHQDEGAESTDERRERDEEGIARVNVMATASEEVA